MTVWAASFIERSPAEYVPAKRKRTARGRRRLSQGGAPQRGIPRAKVYPQRAFPAPGPHAGPSEGIFGGRRDWLATRKLPGPDWLQGTPLFLSRLPQGERKFDSALQPPRVARGRLSRASAPVAAALPSRIRLSANKKQASPGFPPEPRARLGRGSNMDLESKVKKMGLGHEEGFGAPCLKCKDKCEGFELHFWRKICRNCKCGQEEHDVPTSNEDDRKVGKLFEDTKYTTLIAKLKTDGIPVYKRNVMILTNPVAAKKNVSINTVTYEWAPPVQNQTLARHYMQMLPKEKQPVAGSEGAQYRKKQLAKQLPAHDQDPSKCHELTPNEVKQMEQFVKKYKNEALGVGDVKLPSEVEAKSGDKNVPSNGERGTSATVGAMEDKLAGQKGSQYSCFRCKLSMKEGDPAVYAERAGYDKLWHPACFVCCTCGELLVDMIYFWKNGKLYCGRHYCDSEKPRCAGCDELIFSNEYTQAEGQSWHLKHFCCFDCDCVLAGEIYVMVNEKPVCKPCYVKNHAVVCQGCHNAIDPEVQRVSYNNFNWHATTECFLCSCCSKCLIGQKFMPVEGMVFCSVECKKKMMS